MGLLWNSTSPDHPMVSKVSLKGGALRSRRDLREEMGQGVAKGIWAYKRTEGEQHVLVRDGDFIPGNGRGGTGAENAEELSRRPSFF